MIPSNLVSGDGLKSDVSLHSPYSLTPAFKAEIVSVGRATLADLLHANAALTPEVALRV
jgi:plasmid maintenance system antidote protein VapI